MSLPRRGGGTRGRALRVYMRVRAAASHPTSILRVAWVRSEGERVEARAGQVRVAVGRGFDEAEAAVERLCGRHARERIEPQRGIAGRARGVDDRADEARAEAEPAVRIAHVQPLHLAAARVVAAQRRASGDGIVD